MHPARARLAVLCCILGFGGCDPGEVGGDLGRDRDREPSSMVTYPCPALFALAGSVEARLTSLQDAGPELQSCFDRAPADAAIRLPAGKYRIATPVRINKPLILCTDGLTLGVDLSACDPSNATMKKKCAQLVFDIKRSRIETLPEALRKQRTPLLIAADGVLIHHLIMRGVKGVSWREDLALCLSKTLAPFAGGPFASHDDFTLKYSYLGNFTCHSGLVITSRKEGGIARHPVVTNSVIENNGDHTNRWSDGITVGAATEAKIESNVFRDNTDVQLILGDCVGCSIRGNRLLHSGSEAGGSFADLMVWAWANDRGDHTNTVVANNHINCSPQKRCGFGLMIGGDPWREAPFYGGIIRDNAIHHAFVGIDIENLTGPLQELRNNTVRYSGGASETDRGIVEAAPVNIGEPTRKGVDPATRKPFLAPEMITALERDQKTSAKELPIMNYPFALQVTFEYEMVLERRPSASELADRVSRRRKGEKRADIRAELVDSAESQENLDGLPAATAWERRNLYQAMRWGNESLEGLRELLADDSKKVAYVYGSVLARSPSKDELARATGELKAGTVSWRALREQTAGLPECSTLLSARYRAKHKQQPPSAELLQGYVNRLMNGEHLNGVIQSM